jgi:sugar lactone lactonase YvrE
MSGGAGSAQSSKRIEQLTPELEKIISPSEPIIPGQGVSVFQEPTNRANGLTRDLQGGLIACEHDSRRITRQEIDGSITVIANSFQGRRLNRPNDVVVKSDGCVYFTDPVDESCGS